MFLNQHLELQAIQFPSLQDFLHVVRPQNKVYCTIDFCSWYHQIPVSPEYKKLFTFSSFLGTHSYNRAAQGDASSPYAGQQTSRILLSGIEDSLPMIDDVLLAAPTAHKMIDKLEMFFKNMSKCSEPNKPLKIRGDKTHLMEDSVQFFGHKIVKGHVQASQEKVDQITAWEAPSTLQQLQSYLGLTNYLREFIQDYCKKTRPLTSLAKICPKIIGPFWTEEHQECFDNLQKTIRNLPNLRIFDEQAKIHIYADASEDGFGGVIAQEIEEWSNKTHSSSGLLERSNSSLTNVQEAEKKTLAFLEKWIKPGEAPLCGNSVHQDRRFMVKEMQNLEKFLHYRIIDVSTLKELANRWYPEESDNTPPKKRTHLALDDIRESIEELQWYRDNIFKNS